MRGFYEGNFHGGIFMKEEFLRRENFHERGNFMEGFFIERFPFSCHNSTTNLHPQLFRTTRLCFFLLLTFVHIKRT